MKISEIKSVIQLIILILTHGKEAVQALGDIIEEIKSWFRKEKKDPEKPDKKALDEFYQRGEALVSAARGRRVSRKEVDKVARVLWDNKPERVKKMTARRVGKTKRRTV